MDFPTSPLSLIGSIYVDTENLADGPLLNGAVGLRWSFNPEFGFPSNGFRLYKATIENLDNDITFNQPPIYTWTPETSLTTLLGIHSSVSPEYATFLYNLTYTSTGEPHKIGTLHQELKSFITSCAGDNNPYGFRYGDSVDTNSSHSLRKLDAFLLAAIDPNLARFLGLFYLDHAPLVNAYLGYRIIGDWGGQPHPSRSIAFNNLLEGDKSTPVLMSDTVTLSLLNGSFQKAQETSSDWAVILASQPTELTIQWLEPIEEARLVAFDDLQTIEVSVEGGNFQQIAIQGVSLSIVSEGKPFSSITLKLPVEALSHIRLMRVDYRQKIGNIGLQQADWFDDITKILINANQDQLYEGVFHSGGMIGHGTPIPEPALPLPDDSGLVHVPAAQVSLSAYSFNAAYADDHQPVRYIFGRSAGGMDANKQPTPINADLSGNALSPVLRYQAHEPLPEVAGWYPLQNSFTNVWSNKSATPFGEPRFGNRDSDQPKNTVNEPGIEPLPLQNQCLYFLGSSGLYLENLLETRYFSDSFTMLVSVYPTLQTNSTNLVLLTHQPDPSLLTITLTRVPKETSKFDLALTIFRNGPLKTGLHLTIGAWNHLSLTYTGGSIGICLHTRNFAQVISRYRQAIPALPDIWTPELYLAGSPGTTTGFSGRLHNFVMAHKSMSARTLWEKMVRQNLQAKALVPPIPPIFHRPDSQKFPGSAIGVITAELDLKKSTIYSVQFWIKPAEDSPSNRLLFKFTNEATLYLDSSSRLLFLIQGKYHLLARNTITSGAWTHLSVTNDGQQIKFFINGLIDTVYGKEQIIKTNLGVIPILANFKGEIRNLTVWPAPVPPRRLVIQGPRFSHLTERAFLGQQSALTVSETGFYPIKEANMALFFWLYAEESNTDQTIFLGKNGGTLSLSITLAKIENRPAYKLLVFGEGFHKQEVPQRGAVRPNQWTHIGLSLAPRPKDNHGLPALTIFVNGQVFGSQIPFEGSFWLDRFQFGQLGEAPKINFRVRDVQIWDQAISPTELQSFTAPYYLNDRGILPDGKTLYTKKGDYQFQVQGIDLFGRLSPWSNPVQTSIDPRHRFSAPVDLKAEFKPITATIENVAPQLIAPPTEASGQYYLLTSQLDEEWTSGQAWKTLDLNQLIRYEAEVYQVVNKRVLKQTFIIDDCRIEETDKGTLLVLRVKEPPFAQFIPADGNKVVIQYDHLLWISWNWTGIQQVYNPAIKDFAVHLKKGVLTPQLSGTTTQVIADLNKEGTFLVDTDLILPDREFENQFCRIEDRLYLIKSYRGGQLIVEHQVRPAVQPGIGSPVSLAIPQHSSQYKNPIHRDTWSGKTVNVVAGSFKPWQIPSQGALIDISPIDKVGAKVMKVPFGNSSSANWNEGQLDWLPESALLRISIRTFSAPPSEMPTHYASNKIDAEKARANFVPAALVVYVDAEGTGLFSWQVYYLLWYYHKPGELVAFALWPTGTEQSNTKLPVRIKPGCPAAYLYYGKKEAYSLTRDLSKWNLTADYTQKSTENLLLTVEATGEWPGELARPLNLVAVNRQKPKAGPTPRVSFVESIRIAPDNTTELEYFKPRHDGTIDVKINWDKTDADTYQLYRATDSALFERDLHLRRTHSKGSDYEIRPEDTDHKVKTELDIFWDDPDFQDWLIAYRNRPKDTLPTELAARWEYFQSYTKEEEFIKYVLFAKERRSEWNAIEEFWEQWSGAYLPKADSFQRDAEIKKRLYKGRKILKKDGQIDEADLEAILADVATWSGFAHGKLASFYFQSETNPDWIAVSPIWRAWADRFYPALNATDIEGLANRRGNEAAFTLVNTSPIAGLSYTDQVNGRVSNYYLYRVRAYGANGNIGEWGKSSLPERVPIPASPPRTPVFTKVEAGVRQITLQWALNREPDFAGYYLYRAEHKEDLEDLRWIHAKPRPDKVNVQFIPDPRIVVKGVNKERYLLLPKEAPIQNFGQILGIYRADEFNYKASKPEEQPAAMNYYIGSDELSTTEKEWLKITKFRKIAIGTEMVFVYKTDLGESQVLLSIGKYPFVDKGLRGLQSYFYKLCSINKGMATSPLSNFQLARPFETTDPIVPENLSGVRLERNGVFQPVKLIWEVPDRSVKCLVERKVLESYTFNNLSNWLVAENYSLIDTNRSVFEFYDLNAWANTSYEYRIKTMNKVGIMGRAVETVSILKSN